MILFFKKIRYDQIGKNRPGKYIKKAIGEKVFVLIGILLALQINNWNEGVKHLGICSFQVSRGRIQFIILEGFLN
jgi:hypothetical protein